MPDDAVIIEEVARVNPSSLLELMDYAMMAAGFASFALKAGTLATNDIVGGLNKPEAIELSQPIASWDSAAGVD